MENKMTPAWVVENYLPDYDDRWQDYRLQWGSEERDKRVFIQRNFPDALENFRQSIWREACEAQREECAGTVRFESRIYLPEHLRDESYYACKNAPIPEPTKTEQK